MDVFFDKLILVISYVIIYRIDLLKDIFINYNEFCGTGILFYVVYRIIFCCLEKEIYMYLY